MGCDIHCYVEKLDKTSSTWNKIENVRPVHHWEKAIEPDKEFMSDIFDRHYDLFCFLAGVRDYGRGIPTLSEPRDLPPDISDGVWLEFKGWMEDAHSISHLMLSELTEYSYSEDLKKALGDEYFETLNLLKTHGEPDEIRLVFWFDN